MTSIRTTLARPLALLNAFVGGSALAAVAPALPEGFVYERVSSITQGYPTSIGFAAPDRMFIALKSGLVLQARPVQREAIVAHRFQAEGRYRVRLAVRDSRRRRECRT